MPGSNGSSQRSRGRGRPSGWVVVPPGWRFYSSFICSVESGLGKERSYRRMLQEERAGLVPGTARVRGSMEAWGGAWDEGGNLCRQGPVLVSSVTLSGFLSLSDLLPLLMKQGWGPSLHRIYPEVLARTCVWLSSQCCLQVSVKPSPHWGWGITASLTCRCVSFIFQLRKWRSRERKWCVPGWWVAESDQTTEDGGWWVLAF